MTALLGDRDNEIEEAPSKRESLRLSQRARRRSVAPELYVPVADSIVPAAERTFMKRVATATSSETGDGGAGAVVAAVAGTAVRRGGRAAAGREKAQDAKQSRDATRRINLGPDGVQRGRERSMSGGSVTYHDRA